MKHALVIFMLLTGWACVSARGEQHRATHLGNPATRFAPPLSTPDDLRARFRDERLRPDFAEVLRQWGWKGRIEDLFRAAATANINDTKIPVGTTMPFMSSRENGKPICLRNVLWAGDEPAPAYSFIFFSNGIRYRCTTPKACSNFFVENFGADPVPGIALECNAPAEVALGTAVPVCLTVRNSGSGYLFSAVIRLPIPAGAQATSATQGGVISGSEVSWSFANLAPKDERKLCVQIQPTAPGQVRFNASASGMKLTPVETACATRVAGIPALALNCTVPADAVVGRPFQLCLAVRNSGSDALADGVVRLAIPAGAEVSDATEGGRVASGEVTWALGALPADAQRQLCAEINATKPGVLALRASASGAKAKPAETACSTTVTGVPSLALQCAVPGEMFPARSVQVCLTLRNSGSGPVSNAVMQLPLPRGIKAMSASDGGMISASEVSWKFTEVAAGTEKKVCAEIMAPDPGLLTFNTTAFGANAKPIGTFCSTKVIGIPAILIDAVDLEDPIQVGGQVTYEVKVTNQGSSEGTNIRLLFKLPPNEQFVSGGGDTPVRMTEDGLIQTVGLRSLAPKAVAVWRIVVNALQPGDVRLQIDLTSDQFAKPIHEEESTLLY